MKLDEKDNLPIYQQIVNSFIQDIQSASFPPGHKLPTVRELARDKGFSQGTVKHAYDLLEHMGYIEKAQGRGTFVAEAAASGRGSKKELAMGAIDQLLDNMEEWRFSTRETRIFLDLKLRERENSARPIKIAAVDCCPEALYSMCRQIMAMPRADVQEYLLSDVLNAPSAFQPDADLIVTTPTHFDELSAKTAPERNLIRLVMAVSRNTLIKLARISSTSKVGILCFSERFADIIIRACRTYGVLFSQPKVAYFGRSAEVQALLEECDQVILPTDYFQLACPDEQALVRAKTSEASTIYFQYEIERGSFLHLEEQAEMVLRQNNLVS